MKILTIVSPKGGVGKTTIAANLLTRFSEGGYRVRGIDFDPQETLQKWFSRRENPKFECQSQDLKNWQSAINYSENCDILILDLPPSVDANIFEIESLSRRSDLVLVPSGANIFDLDSTAPFICELKNGAVEVIAVLNAVNPREKFFQIARSELNKIAPLCPVEIRRLADGHQHGLEGKTASDYPNCAAYQDFDGLFNFVRRSLNLEA